MLWFSVYAVKYLFLYNLVFGFLFMLSIWVCSSYAISGILDFIQKKNLMMAAICSFCCWFLICYFFYHWFHLLLMTLAYVAHNSNFYIKSHILLLKDLILLCLFFYNTALSKQSCLYFVGELIIKLINSEPLKLTAISPGALWFCVFWNSVNWNKLTCSNSLLYQDGS